MNQDYEKHLRRREKKTPEFAFGVCLTIAYDGTAFHGWQTQPGVRTVQETIEQALDAMGVAHSSVRGASRTDAGVHALGQRAAFGTKQQIEPRGWVLGLNTKLPDDVVIVDAGPCVRGYNPRFHAARKTYRYLIDIGGVADPLIRQRVWHLQHDPELRLPPTTSKGFDVEAVHAAGHHLIGTHDFRAFQAASDPRENTERTIFVVDVQQGWEGRETLVAIEVSGTAFLKNMVRIIAGTLVEVGTGRRSVDSVVALLGPDADRCRAGVTAPAKGLTLVDIVLGRNE